MKTPRAPRLDERRAPEFSAELQERAQAWIPEWGLVNDGERDFGRALLEIAARFNSEVAERLDGAGEKMRRGFLDWLAVRREAARPARMPVVFKLADTAQESVLATAPVRMQADAAGTPVVFETEKDVRIAPGRLEVVVGVDVDIDAFYLLPPGLSDLKPLEPLPTEWRVKSFASAGSNRLQLDPELGLVREMILEAAGQQYRIVTVDKDLVTIEPPLATDLNESISVSKVTSFSPFGGEARNWQSHALYLGDSELLNIEAAATIEVVGASALREGITWEYWGKLDPNDEVGWQSLDLDGERQKFVNDAITLTKPKGAIELHEVGGKNSRWIRAYVETVDPTNQPFTSDEFSIRVNSSGCNQKSPCPPDKAVDSPVAEALANTTPLVLDTIFFPLGKEPRQFDAFYLGSQEAFSKKDAKVQLCFELADRTFSTLAAVREGSFKDQALAGVGKDRSLHLLSFDPTTGVIGKLRDRNALQPPQPGYFGAVEPVNTVALDPQPSWRLPVWSAVDFPYAFAGFLVGTSAGDTIWIWRELVYTPQSSGWIYLGKLPTDGATTNATVDGLVYLAGAQQKLAALRGGALFMRDWPNGTTWARVNTLAGGAPITLKSIVPVLVKNLSNLLVTSSADGMIGIDDKNKLYQVGTNGACVPLLTAYDFDQKIRPVAIKFAGELNVAAVTISDPPKIVANVSLITKEAPLEAGAKALVALEATVTGAIFQVLATVSDEDGKSVLTWAPFETYPSSSIFKSPASGGGLFEGAPVVVDRFIIVPGARADILISEFDLSRRLLKSDNIKVGVVAPDSLPELAINDLIVGLKSGEPVSRKITQSKLTEGGEDFYQIASDFPADLLGLDAYKLSDVLNGALNGKELTLDSADLETAKDDWLLIDNQFYQVESITMSNNDRIAKLVIPNGTGSSPPNGQYLRPIDTQGRVAHFMRLDTSPNGSGDWDASLLTRLPLIFPGKTPREQRGKAFELDGNKPKVVVLGEKFEDPLNNPFEFFVDAAFGEWQRDVGDTSTNPELSWEYWNGKGWWNLDVTRDDTQNLKTTGAVEFETPSDIASSDWAGKTNHWIRARLIGGDYGREKVTVTTKDIGGGVTKQTVDRSSEGIRAPSVVKLHISYHVCKSTQPTFVLTQDSGAIRDQSDANRTSSAIVEAFVPLAFSLGKLSREDSSTELAQENPPDCDCQMQPTMYTAKQGGSGQTSPTPPPLASGRTLFIGLESPLSEAPVNLLLLVEKEQNHNAFAPMTIEALIADRFEPIVAEDTTRALGESGLLSLAFTIPPTPSKLFGKTLRWLRLKPKSTADGKWIPTLRGAYLNAVWASAKETLTRELIGSSDGSPNLALRLARPPVLRDALELRVKEPLGEEEREALLKKDAKSVLSAVDGLPGDWVLWKQVIDPNDEPASARVYALDEATGEIRFGDGLHGAIPSIGRDAIVAFSYSRTEADPTGAASVPGNNVAARTSLNLVSPVETVESVISADHAAGGAAPESDDRVLRFGFARLRHRGRAVTARDIEDLALQSSPDYVQARAVMGPGAIRLVVVVKGKNPTPTAAQARELRRLLLEASPISLSMPNALRIEGPRIRRLRIKLKLLVETLDYAGDLSTFVKTKLTAYFDTSTGGIDKDGWALGDNPSEEDVAFVLIDAPHLEGIEDVKLREIGAGGKVRAWPETLKEAEIVLLADDPFRIEFETSEAPA
jgi:baseplate J-like protein